MMDAAQHRIDEGYSARRNGDAAAALVHYQAAVESLRVLHDPQRLAHSIRHVADLQRKAGELAAAKTNYTEALALYRGDPATGKLDLANTLRGFGLLMEALADRPTARAMWAEAGELYTSVGIQAGVDEAAQQVATLSVMA